MTVTVWCQSECVALLTTLSSELECDLLLQFHITRTQFSKIWLRPPTGRF